MIDPTDARILRLLAEHGRLPNQTLATRAGLSPSACLRRVQAMERRGIIRGTRVLIDKDALGAGFVTYVAVGLAEHSKASQSAFERAVAGFPEVVECHNVAGAFEYLLRVEVADLSAYKRFHTDRLGTVPQVRSIVSYMVMGSPKDTRG
ncbi:MAG: Lrp/AsnC family transcriptional regulator [Paracoccaceae bacterium]